MKGMAKIVAAMLLILTQSFAQSKPATQQQAGDCSINDVGSNNQLTINCPGMSKEQEQKMLVIMNKILASRDFDVVTKKLDKILDAVKAEASPCTPGKPRINAGPDGYKGVCDEDLAQWVSDEAQTINDLAVTCMKRLQNSAKSGESPGAIRFDFTVDFNGCCSEEAKQLRTEVMTRLGPAAKNPEEQRYWEFLFPEERPLPEGVPPELRQRMSLSSHEADCGAAEQYAPYLRFLGLKLKRRAVARLPARQLQFRVTQVAPRNDHFKFKISTAIETQVPISSGYVVVEFSGGPGYVWAPDLPTASLLTGASIIDNKPLTNYLGTFPPYTHPFTLEIGKTPIIPGTPIHVEAEGPNELSVTKVTWFDE